MRCEGGRAWQYAGELVSPWRLGQGRRGSQVRMMIPHNGIDIVLVYRSRGQPGSLPASLMSLARGEVPPLTHPSIIEALLLA